MLLTITSLAAATELPGLTPLASLDLATEDVTLEPLAAVIGPAPFVGLGESKHCAGGYLEAKARVVRWLVEVQGVRLVTLETPWVQAQVARRYVATGEGSSEAAMASVFGAFHDSGTAEMFAWLRAWNERHPDDPVQFTGFDVQDHPARIEEFLADAEARTTSRSGSWAGGSTACARRGRPTGAAAISSR